ncbi:unnamed protein product [Candidula unifasciata]|uniref:Uncharacterized protein n=1 Tax=Candidula unifasciata TaxID=100452 RepID=A0A8S3ZLA2_9EUPU|nr:unnamed protein product [Candidula unifasciata]
MGLQCCLKVQLGLLHCLTGLVAGFFCLYTILSWAGSLDYLPGLLDANAKFIPSNNGLPLLCQCLVYGMGAMCLLNFVMCAVANCLFSSACVALFHTMLTSVFLAFAVMGASVVTVYYVIWCDLLQQAVPQSYGCDDAAIKYDIRNASAQMSSHKNLLQIQMAIGWTLFPLLCLTLLTYSVVVRIVDQPEPETRDDPTRYIIVQDETVPLLRSVNQPTIQRRDTSEINRAVIVTESTTPAVRSEN